MTVDAEFFDDVFQGSPITEDQVNAACVKIMKIVQENVNEARKADRLLKDILLRAIANGLASNPQRCVEHYLHVIRVAFGEPTLLDEVEQRLREM